MSQRIQVICAWCKADMGMKIADAPKVVVAGKLQRTIVSHGICEACSQKYFPEVQRETASA